MFESIFSITFLIIIVIIAWLIVIVNDTEIKWNGKGVTFNNLGNYSKAIECYDKALKKNSNYTDAWHNKGIVLDNLEKHLEAIECYDKALNIDSNYTDAWHNKGIALSKLEKYFEAIECYDKALKIDLNYKYAWHNKGIALSKLEKHSEAIECYDKALKIDLNYKYAWHNKGIVLDKLKKHSKAIECYNKVLEIDPKNIDVCDNKGFALSKLEKYFEAIKYYNKILKENSNDVYAWYNKGNALNKLEKYFEAIECYNKVLEIDSKNTDAWNNKGFAFRKLKKYLEAIECHSKALEIDSNYEYAWYNKGFALSKLEKYSEAIECHSKALEINSNHGKTKNSKKKPNISLDLKTKTFAFNEWVKTKIVIKNNVNGLVKNLIIKFPTEYFNIRQIKPININGNSSKTIEIYLKPKLKNEIQLSIWIEYMHDIKKYTKSFFFKILVETKECQISKKQIQNFYDFTPKQLSMTFLPPELSVNYKNIELIGQGGFARIFKVTRINDNTQVAIKIPKFLDSITGKSFIRELRNWTKMDHQNILKVYDYNILPTPYFEVELCDIDLNEFLKNKNISLKDASFLIFNIAEGLKYAHSLKIIHRDLKPHNILLKNGMPKITDWGLSKVISQSSTTIKEGFTIYYASPEQLDKKYGKIGSWTDIWQLGVIFYQLITNKLPFDGDGAVEIITSITKGGPIPPKKLNLDVDDKLNNIILKCINKKPENRYNSILQLQKDLAIYLQISFKEDLTKSITQKDFSRSIFYCADLISIYLKANNGVDAYKYIGDLINYAKGDIKNDLNKLKQDVEYRVKNDIPISHELVESAGVILHKVKLGFEFD